MPNIHKNCVLLPSVPKIVISKSKISYKFFSEFLSARKAMRFKKRLLLLLLLFIIFSERLDWAILSPVEHYCVQLSTIEHSWAQLCTDEHNWLQLSTIEHSWAQLSTVEYSWAQLSTVELWKRPIVPSWAQLEPNWVILDENEINSQNTLRNHKIWSLKLLGERYKGLKAF